MQAQRHNVRARACILYAHTRARNMFRPMSCASIDDRSSAGELVWAQLPGSLHMVMFGCRETAGSPVAGLYARGSRPRAIGYGS